MTESDQPTTPDPGTPVSTRVPEVGVTERTRKAVSMRIAGATYQQIADACGYADHSGARLAVARGMDIEYPKEDAERLRQSELALAVQVRRALLPDALRGNVKAATAALKYSERIARLTGIDAPARVQVRPEHVEEFLTLAADLGLDGTYTVTNLPETA